MALDLHGDFLAQFFEWKHLPLQLQEISKPFAEHAAQILSTLPANPERTAALRKLLEAKDCAVRCLVAEQNRIRREGAEKVGP